MNNTENLVQRLTDAVYEALATHYDITRSGADATTLIADAIRAHLNPHPVQDLYEHFLSYSGMSDDQMLRYAYFHGANADCEKPAHPPAPAVPDGEAVGAGIAHALERYFATADAVGGCSDGSCVVKRPAGMHTNGGCKCWKDQITAQRMMRAGEALAKAVKDALAHPAHPPATDGEADAFDSDLFERAYAKGYRAALSAAAAECRRVGTALDNGDNEYTRYPEAIKLAVSIQALRVPGAHGSDAHPAQPVSAWVPEGRRLVPSRVADDSAAWLRNYAQQLFSSHSIHGTWPDPLRPTELEAKQDYQYLLSLAHDLDGLGDDLGDEPVHMIECAWIPVRDRLPAPNTDVIGWFPPELQDELPEIEIVGHDGKGAWFCQFGMLQEPTHWMPLPPAPTASNEEEEA